LRLKTSALCSAGCWDEDASPATQRDWWQYDPVADHWTLKAQFGGVGREQAAGFAIGGKCYVGLGEGSSGDGSYSTLWQYDPATNVWTQKHTLSGFSGGGTVSTNATIGGVELGLVVGGGQLYEYNAATDSWFDQGAAPGTGADGSGTPTGFVINHSFFICNIQTESFIWSR
jgi:hypothetical protein